MSDVDSIADLDFTGENTSFLTHGMHSFPARFPPQLVDWAINRFVDTQPATVLDPMCGSGTTLVQSFLMGHNAKGIDKDPLARLMSRVKSNPLNIQKLEKTRDSLREKVVSDINHYREYQGTLSKHQPEDFEDFIVIDNINTIDEVQRPQWQNIDHWFFDQVIDELSIINSRIQELENREHREFFEIVFSSMLITKGKTSLVNAHDIAHSRAHQVKPETKPDTLGRYLEELEMKINTIREFSNEVEKRHGGQVDFTAETVGSDARNICLDDNSIDLIVTSPPYINALNYVRATKFALYWLRWPEMTQKDITPEYIGTDRGSGEEFKNRLKNLTPSETANSQIGEISKNNVRMAGVVHKFVEDMNTAVKEMKKVLKPGKHCIVVIGISDVRDVHVRTPRILNELAKNAGYEIGRKIPRKLDENKRSLPTDRGDMKDGLQDEFVLQWQKPRKN